MALYKYRAVNAAGDVAAGELEAANESEIVDRLRDQGLMPMRVEAAIGGKIAGAAPTPKRRGWFAPRRVTRDNLSGWGKQTTGGFSVRMFPGDHFFLHPAHRAIVKAVTT
jgi:hypothetical protein